MQVCVWKCEWKCVYGSVNASVCMEVCVYVRKCCLSDVLVLCKCGCVLTGVSVVKVCESESVSDRHMKE